MDRLFQSLAWAGVILCGCGALFSSQAGNAWVPFVVLAALCAAYLVYAHRRDKRLERALPAELSRLAYRSDETSVAFAWLTRGGRARRLRILRSQTHGALAADAGGTVDQACVFDGEGGMFVDSDVAPRQTYHYSLFVEERPGAWSKAVHQQVMTYSRSERESIESSYSAQSWSEDRAAPAPRRDALGTTMVPDPMSDPHGLEVERARALGMNGGASLVGNALGGLATDLIFSTASVFTGARTGGDWVEIR